MAYDNKNKYPKKFVAPKSYPIGRKSATASGNDETLVEKCLDMLKSTKEDMKQLNDERLKLYKAYRGDKLGNEIKGRSEIISTDVSNAIESFMPDLMEVFYGGQNVVEIRPQGIGDEEKARLMQEKINFDFQKGMNGYRILHDWLKDALIYKAGIVKWCWKVEDKFKTVEYRDLTDEQFYALQTDDFEIQEHSEEVVVEAGFAPDMMGGMVMITPPVKIHSVKGKKKVHTSKPFVENVAPEEFIFDIKMKNREDGFIAHKREKTADEIVKEYGIPKEDLTEYTDKLDDILGQERFADLGGVGFFKAEKKKDCYYIYECYYPGSDKIVTLLGDKKLREEENTYGCPPFVIISPLLEPHRMIGRGIAELTLIYQQVHTALTRYIMDNIAFQSNGMNIVNPFRINTDDLLNSNKPGGIVRTKYDIDPNSAIFPVPITPLANQVYQFREMSEGMKENAIGITRYNQGLDAKSLNRTATGISQIMSAAQKRIRFIARTLAETGVKELFQDLVTLNLNFFDSEASVKINDEWRTITPEDISGEFDVIIDVGVGTGSTEVKVNQMMQMLQNYGMIASIAGPMVQQIYTLENVKNILKEIWECWGFKDTTKFVAPDMKGAMYAGAGIPMADAGAGIEGQGGIPPTGGTPLAGILQNNGGGVGPQGMEYPA